MSERLELVERFEELRPGMLVVVKPCAWCSGAHRGMLIRLASLALRRSGELLLGRAWHYEPQPEAHEGMPGRGDVLAANSVAERRLYRVVDGLEAPSQEETARKKENA